MRNLEYEEFVILRDQDAQFTEAGRMNRIKNDAEFRATIGENLCSSLYKENEGEYVWCYKSQISLNTYNQIENFQNIKSDTDDTYEQGENVSIKNLGTYVYGRYERDLDNENENMPILKVRFSLMIKIF